MADLVLALMRTLASLRSPRIWFYVLAPAVFSLLLWLGLSFWLLGEVANWLLDYPPFTLLVAWGAVWLAHVLAYLGGWMAIFALAYLTTSLLAALLIQPLMLRALASGPYRDVSPMGADSFVSAVGNSLLAALGFVAGWVLTLPLWLVPGLSLLVPLLLMAWLNRQTFAYDALCQHATPSEWREIKAAQRRPLFFLGLLMAVLAHIPFVGLLVPALAALAYCHFGLEAVRRLRDGAIVSIEGSVI